MNITNETLAQIALQTEQGFLIQNIEKFVTEFTTIEDIEIMAITACWLNIGIRNEGAAYALWAYNKFKESESPLQYVLNKSQHWTRYQYFYTKFTPQHSLHDWWVLMGKLFKIYSTGSTILAEVTARVEADESELDFMDKILYALVDIFDGVKNMPSDTNYIPQKFVRFVMMMVRPRPIGTSTWAENNDNFSPLQSYIPLNSELVKVITDYEILPNPNMTFEFGKSLRNFFAEIFPDDPARGYFSLLGLIDYQPT